jgi:hypothetical protein
VTFLDSKWESPLELTERNATEQNPGDHSARHNSLASRWYTLTYREHVFALVVTSCLLTRGLEVPSPSPATGAVASLVAGPSLSGLGRYGVLIQVFPPLVRLAGVHPVSICRRLLVYGVFASPVSALNLKGGVVVTGVMAH